jgi:hypothetical protein
MQIVGQHHHHAPGGHADQVSELGDVESPGHVPAHAGDTQTEFELPEVKQKADTDHAAQQDASSIPSTPFCYSFYG